MRSSERNRALRGCGEGHGADIEQTNFKNGVRILKLFNQSFAQTVLLRRGMHRLGSVEDRDQVWSRYREFVGTAIMSMT
jgi:hypothetical protein